MSTLGLSMRHLMALIQPSSSLHPDLAQPLYNPHTTVVQPLSSPHPACIQPSSNPHPACIQPTSNPYPTLIQTLSNPCPACVPLPSWLILAVAGPEQPPACALIQGTRTMLWQGERSPRAPPAGPPPRHPPSS